MKLLAFFLIALCVSQAVAIKARRHVSHQENFSNALLEVAGEATPTVNLTPVTVDSSGSVTAVGGVSATTAPTTAPVTLTPVTVDSSGSVTTVGGVSATAAPTTAPVVLKSVTLSSSGTVLSVGGQTVDPPAAAPALSSTSMNFYSLANGQLQTSVLVFSLILLGASVFGAGLAVLIYWSSTKCCKCSKKATLESTAYQQQHW